MRVSSSIRIELELDSDKVTLISEEKAEASIEGPILSNQTYSFNGVFFVLPRDKKDGKVP